MKHRQTDNLQQSIDALKTLRTLPRPVFGHLDGLPNQAIGHRHEHPWGQLSYASQGVVEVATEQGRYVAPPQCAVWIPAQVPHGVHCAPETVIRSLYIDPASISLDRSVCRVLAVTPLLRELIRAFSTLPVEYDESGCDGRLVQVLLDQLVDAPDLGLNLPWPQDARLQRICRTLQNHPDSRTTLAEFGQMLQVSDKTLSRLFLHETGLGFRAWRQRSRLLSSLPLLERGERITDVAIACGYDSMSAFIAAFREQMGTAPRDLFPAKSVKTV